MTRLRTVRPPALSRGGRGQCHLAVGPAQHAAGDEGVESAWRGPVERAAVVDADTVPRVTWSSVTSRDARKSRCPASLPSSVSPPCRARTGNGARRNARCHASASRGMPGRSGNCQASRKSTPEKALRARVAPPTGRGAAVGRSHRRRLSSRARGGRCTGVRRRRVAARSRLSRSSSLPVACARRIARCQAIRRARGSRDSRTCPARQRSGPRGRTVSSWWPGLAPERPGAKRMRRPGSWATTR